MASWFCRPRSKTFAIFAVPVLAVLFLSFTYVPALSSFILELARALGGAANLVNEPVEMMVGKRIMVDRSLPSGEVWPLFGLSYLFVSAMLGTLIAFLIRNLKWRKDPAPLFAILGNIFFSQIETLLLAYPAVKRWTVRDVTIFASVGFATLASGVLYYYSLSSAARPNGLANSIVCAHMMSLALTYWLAKNWRLEDGDELALKDSAEERAGALANCIVTVRVLVGMLAGVVVSLSVARFLEVSLSGLLPSALEAAGGLKVSALCGLIGKCLAPLLGALGLSGDEAWMLGSLSAHSFFHNELSAFPALWELPQVSARAELWADYLLSNFLNVYSIGFQAGGLWVLFPQLRPKLFTVIGRSFAITLLARLIVFFAAVSWS